MGREGDNATEAAGEEDVGEGEEEGDVREGEVEEKAETRDQI